MLIIAMPKTASTSLKTSLCSAHKLQATPEGLWDFPISEEFYRFSRLWSGHMRELTSAAVTEFTSQHAITRMHIIPTKNNQGLLRAYKKVIVLRPPEEVLSSLRRSVILGLNPEPIDFQYCQNNDAAWLLRARKIGLMEEMNLFVNEWETHKGDKLIVYFDDLIQDTKETILRIEDYFGLQRSNLCKLRKDNFTSLGFHRNKIKEIARCVSKYRRIHRKIGKKLDIS